MTRIIAIASLKGGVGKTNVCINLSMLLSAMGKRVLLVDSTPQGDATLCLGVKSSSSFIEDVLLRKIKPRIAIKSTAYFSYDIMPSSPKLNEVAGKLKGTRKAERRLKETLERVKEDYDFIIIDTSSDFNLLMFNDLLATDEIIIPVQCEKLSLLSAKRLFASIKKSKELKNKKISILLTMYAWRNRLSKIIAKEAREDFSEYILNTIIPKTALLAQTTNLKEPILKLAPNSRSARIFRQLAEEVIKGKK